MQRTTTRSAQDVAADLDRLIGEAVPGGRGLGAWRAFLEAHATLMRRLQTDLVSKTGLDLNDRSVVVTLTDAGAARLAETVPVHLRTVAELFVAKLDNQELTVLEGALKKVILDCTFG